MTANDIEKRMVRTTGDECAAQLDAAFRKVEYVGNQVSFVSGQIPSATNRGIPNLASAAVAALTDLMDAVEAWRKEHGE